MSQLSIGKIVQTNISFELKSGNISRWKRFPQLQATDFAAMTWTLPGFDRKNP